ncbi:MAG: uroporphyrinogen-III synthase [Epsilonproteobacteria bacterium]|nr:MAG: uroporphyrinogen-III synthase [Campylobacterota bacterium]
MSNIYLLNDQKFDGVKNLPVFTINYLPTDINFDDFDYIIFTSKNAIKAVDSFANNWKKIPSLVIAPNTAKVAKAYGGKVEFVGTKSYGDEFAVEILNIAKEKKLLFLRAKEVMSNLFDILKHHNIDITQKIIYETIVLELNKNKQPPPDSTIIFSSPSSVAGFLHNFVWLDSYKAVAIGKTTASSLPPYINYNTAKIPSIKEAVKTAKCYI